MWCKATNAAFIGLEENPQKKRLIEVHVKYTKNVPSCKNAMKFQSERSVANSCRRFVFVFVVFAFIFIVGSKAVDWSVFKFYIASKHESQRLLSTSGFSQHNLSVRAVKFS